ncbi:hypothetical protein [Nonomuraea sp. NPDC049625]|uniref:hypothetical protein n=1 Tax=Nonomuraea sp. NPDC049625 TaxID=3155775 RepID=UPI0034218E2F
MEATISVYATRGDAGDGVHDGDGGLAAAGDQVEVARAEVGVEVDREDDERADRGR